MKPITLIIFITACAILFWSIKELHQTGDTIIDIIAAIVYSLLMSLYFFITLNRIVIKQRKLDRIAGRETVIDLLYVFKEATPKSAFPPISILLVSNLSVLTFSILNGRESTANLFNTAISFLISLITWRFFLLSFIGPLVIIFIGFIIIALFTSSIARARH